MGQPLPPRCEVCGSVRGQNDHKMDCGKNLPPEYEEGCDQCWRNGCNPHTRPHPH